MSESVSEILLKQRIRNRLIEYFGIASSYDDIAKFGAYETIEMLEDWISSSDLTYFSEPVFSSEEQAELKNFYAAWETASDETKEDVFDSEILRKKHCWVSFREAAMSAQSIFLKRGHFSEEKEEH